MLKISQPVGEIYGEICIIWRGPIFLLEPGYN